MNTNTNPNPIDSARTRSLIPAWRLIYERLEEIEKGIESGLMTHGSFAESLGISQAGYSQARQKAYAYKEEHGYFKTAAEIDETLTEPEKKVRDAVMYFVFSNGRCMSISESCELFGCSEFSFENVIAAMARGEADAFDRYFFDRVLVA